nr:YopT-type cysteine protease domain-containing protein [uncultured Caldimonas sp.]
MQLVKAFHQGVLGEGCCFRLSVKWVALVLAGDDPAASLYLDNQRPQNSTSVKQAAYAQAADQLGVNLVTLQERITANWINTTQSSRASANRSHTALVYTTSVDFESDLQACYVNRDGEADIVKWATFSPIKFGGWSAVLLSSWNPPHTVAIARSRLRGGRLYGFDPNLGVVTSNTPQQDLAPFLREFIEWMAAMGQQQLKDAKTFVADAVVVVQ